MHHLCAVDMPRTEIEEMNVISYNNFIDLTGDTNGLLQTERYSVKVVGFEPSPTRLEHAVVFRLSNQWHPSNCLFINLDKCVLDET